MTFEDIYLCTYVNRHMRPLAKCHIIYSSQSQNYYYNLSLKIQKVYTGYPIILNLAEKNKKENNVLDRDSLS